MGENTAGEHALQTITEMTGGAMFSRTLDRSLPRFFIASIASFAPSTGWRIIRIRAVRPIPTVQLK
jgi:hypothetical protein